MRFTRHTKVTTSVTVDGIDYPIELGFTPSETMAHYDMLQHVDGKKLIVGYLCDEESHENPCEEDEYFGKFLSSHRHSQDHHEFQKALALDSDWAQDLSLVPLEDAFIAWAQAYANHNTFTRYYNKVGVNSENWNMKESLRKLFVVVPDDEYCGLLSYEVVLRELWTTMRGEGKIGNPLAVSLDIYEHGGQAWSLSGSGTQCKWDTANGGGLWVPSAAATEVIKSNAKALRKGDVCEVKLKTKTQFHVRTLRESTGYDQQLHPAFETYHEAIEYLASIDMPERRSEVAAERVAACDYCASQLDTWNAYLNGDTYFTVIDVYSDFREDQRPDEEDTCGACYGSDDAYKTLQDQFQEHVARSAK